MNATPDAAFFRATTTRTTEALRALENEALGIACVLQAERIRVDTERFTAPMLYRAVMAAMRRVGRRNYLPTGVGICWDLLLDKQRQNIIVEAVQATLRADDETVRVCARAYLGMEIKQS